MNKLATIVLTIAAISIALPAGLADPCKVSTSKSTLEHGKYYLVAGLTSIWVYEESNGMKGLQRGDVLKDDTCQGQVKSDDLVA